MTETDSLKTIDLSTCFVIAPIGMDGSETRRRSDLVLRHVIEPPTNECGYKAVRADKISEPGMITTQIIQLILQCPLVIADLTESNPNVFYELAIRHAVKKPVVQLIKKGEKIPFDLTGMRTIEIDHTDLDNVENAKSEIIRQIKFLEGKTDDQIESPISISLELQFLKKSENPEDRSLANILSAVSELRTDLSSIQNKISSVSQIRNDVSSIQTRISSPENLLPASYFRLIANEFNLKTRSFRTIINETKEFFENLRDSDVFQSNDDNQFDLKKRMEFILHMMKRELSEETIIENEFGAK